MDPHFQNTAELTGGILATFPFIHSLANPLATPDAQAALMYRVGCIMGSDAGGSRQELINSCASLSVSMWRERFVISPSFEHSTLLVFWIGFLGAWWAAA